MLYVGTQSQRARSSGECRWPKAAKAAKATHAISSGLGRFLLCSPGDTGAKGSKDTPSVLKSGPAPPSSPHDDWRLAVSQPSIVANAKGNKGNKGKVTAFPKELDVRGEHVRSVHADLTAGGGERRGGGGYGLGGDGGAWTGLGDTSESSPGWGWQRQPVLKSGPRAFPMR